MRAAHDDEDPKPALGRERSEDELERRIDDLEMVQRKQRVYFPADWFNDEF